MTIPRDRVKFSAIVDRPKLRLPPGKRIVVWTIVNLEVWDIAKRWAAGAAAPTGVRSCPTCRTGAGTSTECAWVLALSRALRAFENRPTSAINARVCVDYRASRRRARTRVGNSWGTATSRGDPQRERQPAMIQRSLDTIEKFTGKRPVGWLGPGLTETYETPEHSRRRA